LEYFILLLENYKNICIRHLPEALVAAFAKRLGRLALTAASTDVLIIIPFVGNLLLRHKGLQKMIHSTEGGFGKNLNFILYYLFKI